MRFSPGQWRRTSIKVLFVCIAVFSFATLAMSQAQSNAADLQGVVRDPKGAAISGATVTARNTATNLSRTATTDGDVFTSETGGDTWSQIASGLAPISKVGHYRNLVAV